MFASISMDDHAPVQPGWMGAILVNIWSLGLRFATSQLERATGIEPAQPAWKAGTLPLSYARALSSPAFAEPFRQSPSHRGGLKFQLVEGVGFEPT
jgi:hypothetical protein